MNAAYFQAAIPEPFRVLGRSMKPFTLGHELLLERFNSGFAIGRKDSAGENDPYTDLIFSIYLCSFTYSEAIKQISSKWALLRVALWSWKVRLLVCLREWNQFKWSRGHFDVPETIEHFRRYIESHTAEPEYWIEREGTGGKSAVPFVQFLKVRLEQDLGYTEQQALETPFQMALWNYLTFLEGKGIIRFMTDEDRALLKASRDPKTEAWLAKIAEKHRATVERLGAK